MPSKPCCQASFAERNAVPSDLARRPDAQDRGRYGGQAVALVGLSGWTVL
jgi:hypothetical protein